MAAARGPRGRRGRVEQILARDRPALRAPAAQQRRGSGAQARACLRTGSEQRGDRRHRVRRAAGCGVEPLRQGRAGLGRARDHAYVGVVQSAPKSPSTTDLRDRSRRLRLDPAMLPPSRRHPGTCPRRCAGASLASQRHGSRGAPRGAHRARAHSSGAIRRRHSGWLAQDPAGRLASSRRGCGGFRPGRAAPDPARRRAGPVGRRRPRVRAPRRDSRAARGARAARLRRRREHRRHRRRRRGDGLER